MNEVANSIKKLRQEKQLSQEQLAEQLHVTRQAVSSWETGKTQPDIETLTRLAEFFGVSVEHLIYGKPPKTESEQNVKRWEWNRGRFHLAVNYYPQEMLRLGMVLATVVSYVKWQSIGWAILHGLLNWGYILYYLIRY